VNGVGDRPARVGCAEHVAHVEHVAKEPQRAQEDAEDQDLLALERPALDLLHRREDARVLGVGVEFFVYASHTARGYTRVATGIIAKIESPLARLSTPRHRRAKRDTEKPPAR